MILPFLTQNITYAWQVVSICCKSSAYEQAKLVKCFHSYYFLLKHEKKKIHLCVFNQFSIVLPVKHNTHFIFIFLSDIYVLAINECDQTIKTFWVSECGPLKFLFLTNRLKYRFLSPRPLSDFGDENEGDKMWVYVIKNCSPPCSIPEHRACSIPKPVLYMYMKKWYLT